METVKWSKAVGLFALTIVFSMTGCSGSDSGNTNQSEPESTTYPTWMTEYYSDLEAKTLSEIALPGSHDSGMSTSQHCYTGNSCNTQAQNTDVSGQLNWGVRYLDIRPARLHGKGYDGTWFTAHGTSCTDQWAGCMGVELSTIFKDIYDFVSSLPSGNKELIIVNLSHCYTLKTRTVFDAYCDECSSTEWGDVVNEAYTTLSDYMLKYSGDSLESTKYGTLMQDGGHVILRVENNSIPTEYSKGIINANDFPIYNDYSNTTDIGYMIQDQTCKFLDSDNHDNKLFLLSWTLTLSGSQVAKCEVGGKSILRYAREARSHLTPEIDKLIDAGWIYQGYVPNIIYVDDTNNVATDVAITLNTKLPPEPKKGAQGYWILNNFGQVSRFGDAACIGSHDPPNEEFVDMGRSPTGDGYCMLADWGGVNCYGDADYYGHHEHSSDHFVALAMHPSGDGYCMLADWGGVNCYSKEGVNLYHGHHPHTDYKFVDLAWNPDGTGYCMLADWGGVNCYDADYYGHHEHSSDHFVALAMHPEKGYCMMTDTGGVNCYEAPYYGHESGDTYVDIAWAPDGKGYWLMSKTGGINAKSAQYWGHDAFDWPTEAKAIIATPLQE